MIASLPLALRDAIREVSWNRGGSVLSVLCLGLAIGINATVFTFVNALLLRPLPLPAAEELVSVHEARREDPEGIGPASYPNFLDWKAHASELAGMAAQRTANLRLSDGGPPERYAGALVSANFFEVLGVRPAAGRGFRDEEDRPGGSPVVLLSHSLWQQRYGGDPGMVGRVITVDGTARTVVGILPSELSQIALQRALRGARLWIPLGSADPDDRRERRRLTVVARLRSAATLDAARAQLAGIARTLEASYPAENDGWTVVAQPVRLGLSGTTRGMLLMMMGAVSFVVLMACANVANLTLARAATRRREIATRLALGASRGRIIWQLLTERLIVSVASIPVGIAIAYWGRTLLLAGRASPELIAGITIDLPVLTFTACLAGVAGLLAGLLPALHAVRHSRFDLLRGGPLYGTSGPPHTRLGHTLIAGEVALALVLLVGASLFVRSFRNLLGEDGGFDTARILAVGVEMAEADARVADSIAHQVGELTERLQALPGVTSAAAANFMPLRDGGERAAIVSDRGNGPPGAPANVLLGSVTSGFFRVLDVPIVQGRAFTEDEVRSGSRVAIVNEAMARRLWPNETAIGHRFRPAADRDAWFTVVGVSEGILTWDVSNRVLPAAYVPYPHAAEREPRLLLRASGDPSLLIPSVRAAIQAFDPRRPILGVRTMSEVHYQALSRQQTLASLFAALGGIALLLAATGVFGVLSYLVSQRTREIGIRAALGADRRSLVRLFVRQGVTMTLAGTVVGLPGAVALARVLRRWLHHVAPTDPLSLAGSAILLTAVAIVATYLPARRAASGDPLIAIRE